MQHHYNNLSAKFDKYRKILSNNYAQNNKITISPNPCETSTKISFYMPKTEHTSIKIMNLQGEKVAVLRNETMNKGWHTIELNMRNNNMLSTKKGLFLLQIQQGNFVVTEKIIIL